MSPHPTIAVFTKNALNPAYAAARLGADRAAQRMGAHTVHYVPATPDDPGEQIALIDDALAQRPDAVVMVPVHSTAIAPSLRKIQAAGIPMTGCINRFTEARCITFVGSDDRRLGKAIAAYLFERLQGRGKVLLVEGTSGSVTNVDRVRGFHDAATDYPAIEIAATGRGDYQREPARRLVAGLLGLTPRIDGIIAANDAMALGAIDALAAAGRTSAVVGVNAVPEAVAAIRQGRMLATVDFDAMQMAYLATEAAIRHLRGESVPTAILLPVQVVDRTNCAQWDKAFAQRECVPWEAAIGHGSEHSGASESR